MLVGLLRFAGGNGCWWVAEVLAGVLAGVLGGWCGCWHASGVQVC